VWIAANALTISWAYFTSSPGVYGKKQDGSLQWPVALWMASWLLFGRVIWHLQNIVSRTPLYSEIVPDLFVGRLCGYQSLPRDVSVVVDLTAEFPTPRSMRENVLTICLPTLDGCPPDWKKCQQVFELISNQPGRIYVCCANGHGRSVTFVAAWLGLQGKCHSAPDAVKLIQTVRPSAAPNRDQISFLNNVFQTMNSVGPSTID
jgi:protein-tyrosine phosphatase